MKQKEIDSYFFEVDILIVAKRLGLSLEELEEIPFSMFRDLAIRRFGLQDDSKKGKESKPSESVRLATQHDMDLL